MRNVLMAAAAAALLAGCHLAPDPAVPAPEPTLVTPAAEPQVPPRIEWQNAGGGTFFYHHVGGDCAILTHGHGRNNAWGLWRLPLGKVAAEAPTGSEDRSYRVRFACTDASACIEAGALGDTPGRQDAHEIPFETLPRAERFLSDVAALETACNALK